MTSGASAANYLPVEQPTKFEPAINLKAASYRLVASLADKILRGAKPADLPIQQPTKFELVINMISSRAACRRPIRSSCKLIGTCPSLEPGWLD